MPKRIFLSYRRDDSSGHAQHLHKDLARHYGAPAIFIDVHKIRPLDRFKDVITDAIRESGILFVVMSKQWATAANSEGASRLLNPEDIVCLEIADALDHDVPVLPVLVGGASMPLRSDLPERIQGIVDITAHVISDAQWDRDIEELIRIVDRTTEVAAPSEVNPFGIRASIADDVFFHDRERERRRLRDYVRNRQNCQMVGPRRIGKSSLLRYVERHAIEWAQASRVAYLDLQESALLHVERMAQRSRRRTRPSGCAVDIGRSCGGYRGPDGHRCKTGPVPRRVRRDGPSS